ncbi:hypothetical protein QJS10_CPB14g01360 [Acorus calamus]|uniref:Uncharacterized protein n=1 Tax=Acorus calamus TaxID=4465 RepID=A0AAV9DEI9_ACOCL|nr:hypothetical protein QJS10_CPB14g01360 [Acorus calamus]
MGFLQRLLLRTPLCKWSLKILLPLEPTNATPTALVDSIIPSEAIVSAPLPIQVIKDIQQEQLEELHPLSNQVVEALQLNQNEELPPQKNINESMIDKGQCHEGVNGLSQEEVKKSNITVAKMESAHPQQLEDSSHHSDLIVDLSGGSPSSEVTKKSVEQGDHSPMKVISAPSYPAGPRPFKYFESWEAHPTFSATVEAAWDIPIVGNPLYRFVKKLALQQNPRDSLLMVAESMARHKYTDLLSQEEKFARQKSRQLWLEAGLNGNNKLVLNL